MFNDETIRRLQESNALSREAFEANTEWLARKARREKDSQAALINLFALARANYASEFCASIRSRIQEFDARLDQAQEVGIQLVSFGQTITFHVTDLGYQNPSMLTFSGLLDNGNPVSLLQHVSQLNFLLVALKRQHPEQPKVPFGFAAGRQKPTDDAGTEVSASS